MNQIKATLKLLLDKITGNKTSPIEEDDMFIKRLRSSVIGEGMLPPQNVSLMAYAIQHMPDIGVVLEIGSYAGLSANIILHLMSKHAKPHKMYCVDAWIYEGYHDQKELNQEFIDGRSDVLRSDYCIYIKNAFIQSMRLFQPHRLPYAFHEKSSVFFSYWNKKEMTDVFGRTIIPVGPISFAYIDGDHSYVAAKDDYENTLRLLMPGGFILLDDTAKELRFGSVQLRNEIMTDSRIEIVSSDYNLLIRKK